MFSCSQSVRQPLVGRETGGNTLGTWGVICDCGLLVLYPTRGHWMLSSVLMHTKGTWINPTYFHRCLVSGDFLTFFAVQARPAEGYQQIKWRGLRSGRFASLLFLSPSMRLPLLLGDPVLGSRGDCELWRRSFLPEPADIDDAGVLWLAVPLVLLWLSGESKQGDDVSVASGLSVVESSHSLSLSPSSSLASEKPSR